jgi:hypothetical protein
MVRLCSNNGAAAPFAWCRLREAVYDSNLLRISDITCVGIGMGHGVAGDPYPVCFRKLRDIDRRLRSHTRSFGHGGEYNTPSKMGKFARADAIGRP